MAAFKKKFGRDPKADEPIFFDPSVDEPKPITGDFLKAGILDAMQKAGTPPEIVYAYRKTGLLLNDSRMDSYPAEAVSEWDDAIAEYFSMEAKPENSDAASPGEARSASGQKQSSGEIARRTAI